MKIKDISLIAVMTALQVGMTLGLPLISLTTLIIAALTLTMTQALMMSVLTACVTMILSGKILTALNIILLPAIVWVIKKYQQYRLVNCSKAKKRNKNFELGGISFILILGANILSEIAASVVIGGGMVYILSSLPIAFLGALLNAMIIAMIAISAHYRICKLYLKLNN